MFVDMSLHFHQLVQANLGLHVPRCTGRGLCGRSRSEADLRLSRWSRISSRPRCPLPVALNMTDGAEQGKSFSIDSRPRYGLCICQGSTHRRSNNRSPAMGLAAHDPSAVVVPWYAIEATTDNSTLFSRALHHSQLV
jgi:hypothetical protein